MRYETQVPESRIILIVNPIGWEGDVRFMDQSQSEVMQNLIMKYFRHNWKLL